MSTTGEHLSIGEVLALLQDEFPDVTISKIRFLESQGLLDPERTPSGYRKFYDSDIVRLRWILQQQSENFLPLKVIKERLEAGEAPGGPEPADEAADPLPLAAEEPTKKRPARAKPLPSIFSPGGAENPLVTDQSDVSMSLEDLAAASGLPVADVQELVQFALLAPRDVAGRPVFDGDALVVARAAAEMKRHGLEARHLRAYKVAADREAGMLEQVVAPMLKQRNPKSRQQATEVLGELAVLGSRLRNASLRMALRDHLPNQS
ncbi:MAG: MerR family transcriptional regulator [Acidimicrobiales bacterium]